MEKQLFALALAVCLLLCGCSGNTPQTSVPTDPTVGTTEPATVPTETVPPTTAPPETEPELILEAGPGVTADGDVLPSGTVLFQDAAYMKLEEFLLGFDNAQYSGDASEGYVLTFGGHEFGFLPGQEAVTVDGTAAAITNPVLVYQNALWVPVAEICDLIGISFLEDVNQNHLYCTSVGYGWDWARGVEIPILMYHGVTDNTWGAVELFVSPDDMEEQIVWLLDNGFDPITFEDWSHLEDFDKPIMLTFDDGYRDNYEELFPILQKYNVKVTIFLIASSIDNRETAMTSQQILEMHQSGLVSFQSHTYSHPHLSQCDTKKLNNEMVWSKIVIARITGYEPFVLCYPYGDRSDEARELAMEQYRFALAMNGGLCTTGDDVSQIPRYYVSRYSNIWEFAAMAQGG